jgi:glycosyltransferase involved in cell wall biosynthesis
MRVLVVSNMRASPQRPQLGSFVRDQVAALERAGVDATLFEFEPGRRNLAAATRAVRRELSRQRYDVVHAHYGLTGWACALAGARPLVVTFHGTDVRHRVVGPLSRALARRLDLAAPVSRTLLRAEGGRPGLRRRPGRTAILPCGPDLSRFRPLDRAESRRRVGLAADGRYLLFPADPSRAVKRADRAARVAELTGAELLTAGRIDPAEMPAWINAASAVLVTSETEGFGLAAAEALACDVPVLSTPVGIAPALLAGISGCLVATFDELSWAEAARRHLDDPDPRVPGAARAQAFSADRMARRVACAYADLADSSHFADAGPERSRGFS